MKKVKCGMALFLATLLLTSAFQPLEVSAKEYGDYIYTVFSGDTVGIYNYTGSEKNLVIPSEIEGKKVTLIEDLLMKAAGEGQLIVGSDNLESVEIPDSVETVRSGCFENCPNLKRVYLSANLKSIQCDVFKKCTSLNDINTENITVVDYNAFEDCMSLTDLNLESVGVIGVGAFRNCVNLERVVLGNHTEIDEDAFTNCPKLKKLYFLKGLEFIDDKLPDECSNLTDIYFEGTQEEWNKVISTQTAEKLKGVTVHYNHPAFYDVNETDWFYHSVQYVNDKSLMTGLNRTTFGAGQPLARAQFAVILHRINGEPKMEYMDRFKDVPKGEWYTDAVLWAASNGIVNGYDDTGLFGTADNINREQMAVMMYRYAKYKGYDISKQADFSRFTDAASVSGFASDAMKWAVGNEIITGKDGTMLDPQGDAVRAECATIIMRFVEKYE